MVGLTGALSFPVLHGFSAGAQDRALKIVVVEGEGAVNIVRQGTATAPVVEVRDRNDQPVAGAVVTFVIRSGRVTFSGARTFTVTSNAVGRAAAAGLTPTGSGAVQIGASAAFQGQTAVATIVQTNVMTAAQAAAATSAAGSSASGGASGGASGAGGAAGGGAGAGVSVTAVGIVGGAVAGGTLVATQVIAGGPVYTAQFSGDEDLFTPYCRTEALTGTLEIELNVSGDTVSGTARIEGSILTTRVSSGCQAFLNATDGFHMSRTTVSGAPAAIVFSRAETNDVPPNQFDPQGTTNTHEFTFSGALNNDVITGTLFHRRIVGGRLAGTHTFLVTARR